MARQMSNYRISLIDSEYMRYGLTVDAKNVKKAICKMPKPGQTLCDRCTHNHAASNTHCRQNAENATFLDAPPDGRGVYLYNIDDGKRLPGVWAISHTFAKKRKTGTANIILL